jgi:ABC-type Na+ transport system ATPase subunit NatA
MKIAQLHGERHDLWWEFPLIASFRWQAYIHDLEEALWHRRLARLATALGLRSLLDCQVDELSPSERARANLALALLPRPDLLVWRSPPTCLSPAEWGQVHRLLRRRRGLHVIFVPAKDGALIAQYPTIEGALRYETGSTYRPRAAGRGCDPGVRGPLAL